MSYPYELALPAAEAPADARAAFIRRTYGHLAGAILAFIVLETFLLQLPGIERVVATMLAGGRMGWLLVLGGFMLVSWLADRWAQSDQSVGKQYLGLGLYVVAQGVLFLPLLYIAAAFYPGAIETAGILTGMTFLGLTVAVLFTRRDFSYLAPILSVGGLLAIGVIVAGMLFGFELGLWFLFAMVALASGYIIYQTSAILHQYRTDQHVAAALALFASVMLLFWYILQIVMRNRD
jgi:FtsH-binding integral membrane protein